MLWCYGHETSSCPADNDYTIVQESYSDVDWIAMSSSVHTSSEELCSLQALCRFLLEKHIYEKDTTSMFDSSNHTSLNSMNIQHTPTFLPLSPPPPPHTHTHSLSHSSSPSLYLLLPCLLNIISTKRSSIGRQ